MSQRTLIFKIDIQYYGRQTKASRKVCILIPGTYEYVNLYGKEIFQILLKIWSREIILNYAGESHVTEGFILEGGKGVKFIDKRCENGNRDWSDVL